MSAAALACGCWRAAALSSSQDAADPVHDRGTPSARVAALVSGLATVGDVRFGPFAGQMLVGEFQNAAVFRVALEKVNGRWQGAVFPFVKGFASGVNRLAYGPDSRLYVGGLRMGHWTSIAPQPHSLDRVTFKGRSPFEFKTVSARPNGFVVAFTQPVDAALAGNPENWDATQYTYAYDGKHNAPEKDRDEKIPGPPVRVTHAAVADDRLSVRLGAARGCSGNSDERPLPLLHLHLGRQYQHEGACPTLPGVARGTLFCGLARL